MGNGESTHYTFVDSSTNCLRYCLRSSTSSSLCYRFNRGSLKIKTKNSPKSPAESISNNLNSNNLNSSNASNSNEINEKCSEIPQKSAAENQNSKKSSPNGSIDSSKASISSNNSSYYTASNDIVDANAIKELLDGTIDLRVRVKHLNKEKIFTFDRQMPLYDVLVKVSNHFSFNPSEYSIIAADSNDDSNDDYNNDKLLTLKSNPIGLIRTDRIVIVPKLRKQRNNNNDNDNNCKKLNNSNETNHNSHNNNGLPFTKTIRFTINLPKNQLKVKRIEPTISFNVIKTLICEEKSLDSSKYLLVRPLKKSESITVIDLQRCPADYGINEATLISVRNYEQLIKQFTTNSRSSLFMNMSVVDDGDDEQSNRLHCQQQNDWSQSTPNISSMINRTQSDASSIASSSRGTRSYKKKPAPPPPLTKSIQNLDVIRDDDENENEDDAETRNLSSPVSDSYSFNLNNSKSSDSKAGEEDLVIKNQPLSQNDSINHSKLSLNRQNSCSSNSSGYHEHMSQTTIAGLSDTTTTPLYTPISNDSIEQYVIIDDTSENINDNNTKLVNEKKIESSQVTALNMEPSTKGAATRSLNSNNSFNHHQRKKRRAPLPPPPPPLSSSISSNLNPIEPPSSSTSPNINDDNQTNSFDSNRIESPCFTETSETELPSSLCYSEESNQDLPPKSIIFDNHMNDNGHETLNDDNQKFSNDLMKINIDSSSIDGNQSGVIDHDQIMTIINDNQSNNDNQQPSITDNSNVVAIQAEIHQQFNDSNSFENRIEIDNNSVHVDDNEIDDSRHQQQVNVIDADDLNHNKGRIETNESIANIINQNEFNKIQKKRSRWLQLLDQYGQDDDGDHDDHRNKCSHVDVDGDDSRQQCDDCRKCVENFQSLRQKFQNAIIAANSISKASTSFISEVKQIDETTTSTTTTAAAIKTIDKPEAIAINQCQIRSQIGSEQNNNECDINVDDDPHEHPNTDDNEEMKNKSVNSLGDRNQKPLVIVCDWKHRSSTTSSTIDDNSINTDNHHENYSLDEQIVLNELNETLDKCSVSSSSSIVHEYDDNNDDQNHMIESKKSSVSSNQSGHHHLKSINSNSNNSNDRRLSSSDSFTVRDGIRRFNTITEANVSRQNLSSLSNTNSTNMTKTTVGKINPSQIVRRSTLKLNINDNDDDNNHMPKVNRKLENFQIGSFTDFHSKIDIYDNQQHQQRQQTINVSSSKSNDNHSNNNNDEIKRSTIIAVNQPAKTVINRNDDELSIDNNNKSADNSIQQPNLSRVISTNESSKYDSGPKAINRPTSIFILNNNNNNNLNHHSFTDDNNSIERSKQSTSNNAFSTPVMITSKSTSSSPTTIITRSSSTNFLQELKNSCKTWSHRNGSDISNAIDRSDDMNDINGPKKNGSTIDTGRKSENGLSPCSPPPPPPPPPPPSIPNGTASSQILFAPKGWNQKSPDNNNKSNRIIRSPLRSISNDSKLKFNSLSSTSSSTGAGLNSRDALLNEIKNFHTSSQLKKVTINQPFSLKIQN